MEAAMHVIITGASRGLGKAMAEKFASSGHHLYLCSRSELNLYHTLEELVTKYPESSIQAKPFDLSKEEQAKAFARWILDRGISTDILINNAGQFIAGRIYDEAEGVLEKMMAINLYSAYHVTRLLLPAMIEKKNGHIFNICSTASLNAYPNGGSYSISKYALAGFSKNLREELKSYGIKVTTVYPGAAYTDSWADSGVDPQRIMDAADIAAMVYAASRISSRACVEEILLRPQLGDLA